MKNVFLTILTINLLLFSCEKNPTNTSLNVENRTFVFYNGDIITMEGDMASYAEAVVVKDDKILFVGNKDETLRQACET